MARLFRWTRETYRQAHHLDRLLNRFYSLPEVKPLILERFHNLHKRHPQHDDVLLTPVKARLIWKRNVDDDIPF
jgi:hypothetical protein